MCTVLSSACNSKLKLGALKKFLKINNFIIIIIIIIIIINIIYRRKEFYAN